MFNDFLGKNCSNISLLPTDFGIAKSVTMPPWLPSDSLNELLAMSLLQGDLDHFIITFLNDEKGWRKWYTNPLNETMPRIADNDNDKSSKLN